MKPKQKAAEIFNKVRRNNYLNSIDISKYVTREIIKGINKAFDEYQENTKVYVKNRINYYDYYEDVNLELLKKEQENQYLDFHIDFVKDKSDARKVIADFENEEEYVTHDLKVYLSYREYKAVGEHSEYLSELKKSINDIKEKFNLK